MSGVNKVIIVGNLGQDPEIRYMPNGNAVANVTIATSEKWKDKQTGQDQEKTEWHRVVFFGKLAEIVGQYLRKGSKVYIDGKLRTRKWQAEDGSDRYSTEIVVDMGGTMQMLDSRQDGQQTPQRAPQQQGGYQQAPQQAPQRAPRNTPPQGDSHAQQQPQYDNFDDSQIPF